MDKCAWYFMLVMNLTFKTGLISAAGGFWDTFFSRRRTTGVDYAFDTRSDVIRHRHLLQTEEIVTTVATPPQEKDLITKINEFYADKNNMAMFCVLPIMVVVYGGCSLIYCIAKLRRYIRKRHNRAPRDDRVRLNNHEEQNDLNSQDFNNISSDSHNPAVPPPPPSVPPSVSPPPWVVQKEPMVQPMVPPMSSYHPAKPSNHMSRYGPPRDEKRRDYKDLLHIKPTYVNNGYEEENRPRIREAYRMKGPEDVDGRDSVQSYKDELLARYDTLSSFTMARKAATILRSGTNEKQKKEKEKESDSDLFNGKPRQKMIFIAE